MALSNSSPLVRLFASSTVLAACALLAACGHTTSGAASSSPSMTSQAALGPVYFGDVMAFGAEEIAAPAATLVATSITLEY